MTHVLHSTAERKKEKLADGQCRKQTCNKKPAHDFRIYNLLLHL